MISIIIPVLNEEHNLTMLTDELIDVCKRIKQKEYELIFVSDGSTDQTNTVIKMLCRQNPHIRGLLFRFHQGKSSALQAGFEVATGDPIITIDGDGQDNPHELPKLLAQLDKNYDMVSGWKQHRKDSFIKTRSSRLFNTITSLVTGLSIHDFNCGYKAYKKEAAKSLVLYGELHRYIPILLASMGFHISEVPVEHRPRFSGASKYGVARFFHGFFDLFTMMLLTRFKSRPLHLFGYIGSIFFSFGFLGALYLTMRKFLFHEAIGERPLLLLSVMLMIMGVQIAVTGLIGEYLTFLLRQKKSDPISTLVKYEHNDT